MPASQDGAGACSRWCAARRFQWQKHQQTQINLAVAAGLGGRKRMMTFLHQIGAIRSELQRKKFCWRSAAVQAIIARTLTTLMLSQMQSQGYNLREKSNGIR
jgi:hypothetical protein